MRGKSVIGTGISTDADRFEDAEHYALAARFGDFGQ